MCCTFLRSLNSRCGFSFRVVVNLLVLCVAFFVSLFVSILVPSFAHATNSGITYQGRILRPDGTVLEDANVQFKMQIRSPDNGNCLLYEEVQTLNMTDSKGLFGLTMNDGNGATTAVLVQDGAAAAAQLPIDRIFANRGTFTFSAGQCANGGAGTVYTPNQADGRRLVVYFKDSTMAAWEQMPTQMINYVPFAFEAKEVQGFSASSLVRVQEADGTMDSVSPLSNANYTELLALIGGTSAQYSKVNQLRGVTVPAMGNNQYLQWSGGAWVSADPVASVQSFAKTALPTCSAGDFLKDNGSGGLVCATPSSSGGSVTSVATGTGLTGGTITASGTIALAAVGSGGTGFKVTYDNYGRVTGAIALVEADIPTLVTAGKVSGSAIASGTIGGSTAINTTGSISTTSLISTTANINANTATVTNVVASGTVSAVTVSGRTVQLFNPTGTANKITMTADPTLSADYTLTWPLTAGSSGQVLTTNGAGILTWTSSAIGNTASLSLGKVWIGDGTSKAQEVSLSGDATVNASGVLSLKNTGTAGSYYKVTTDSQGRVASGSASLTVADLPNTLVLNGGNTTGASMTIGANDLKAVQIITNGAPKLTVIASGSVGIGTQTPQTLFDVNGTLRVADGGEVCAAGIAGAIRYNGGNIAFCNGATWTNLGVAGAGITGLTGDVVASGSGSVAATIQPGAVTSSKIAVGGVASSNLAAGAVTTNAIAVGAVTSAAIAANAVTTGAIAAQSVTYAKIQNVASQSLLGNPTAAAASAQEIAIGTGLTLSASGTLSATGLSAVSNTATLNTAKIWVGDGTNKAQEQVMSGDATLAASGVLSLKNTGTAGSYYKVTTDAQGRVASGAAALLASDMPSSVLLNGGNTTGASMTIGANDTKAVQLITGGAPKLTVIASGSVGIGTTTPQSTFDVNGVIRVSDDGETCTGLNPGAIRYSGGNLAFCNGVSWSNLGVSGAGITALTGDVVATGSGSVAATIQPGSVTSSKIAVGGVASSNLAVGSVTTNAIAVGAVTSSALAAQSVTYAKIQNVASQSLLGNPSGVSGSVQEISIGSGLSLSASGQLSATLAGVSGSATLNNGKIWIGDGTNKAQEKTISGDVTLSNTGSATVAFVGGSIASAVNAATILANAATALNTSSALVLRDGTGNFAANVATFNGVGFNNAGSVVTLTNPIGSSYSMVLPQNLGTNGQVLTTNGSGSTSWTTAVTSATGFVQGGNTFGASAVLGTNDANALQFRTNGANQMTIASSGYVGIGTTNPAGKLDVQGSGSVMFNAGNVSVLTPSNQYGFNVGGTAALGANLYLMNCGGNLGCGNYGLFSFLDTSGNLNYTTPGGGTQKHLTFNPSGNVGIGTLSPTSKLSINGSMSFANGSGNVGFLASSAAGTANYTWPTSVAGGNFLQTDASGNLSWASVGGGGDFFKNGSVAMTGAFTAQPGAAAAPGLSFIGNSSTGLFQPASSTLGFAIAGAEKVRIDASGNVGIGTQTPNNRLDIIQSGAGAIGWGSAVANSQLNADQGGSLELGGTNSIANPVVTGTPYIDFHYGTGGIQDFNTRITNAANNRLDFVTNSNGTVMSVSGANVGIGTISPAAKLAVNGSMVVMGSTSGYSGFVASSIAGSTVWTLPTADGASGQVLSTNGSGQLGWTTVGGGAVWSASGTNAYYSTGNVGVGTSSPAYNFDVSGSAGVKNNLTVGYGSGGTLSVWGNFNMGQGNSPSGAFATALGWYNSATANQSFASGANNSVTAGYATALGISNSVTGYNSFAEGNNNTVSAGNAAAVGDYLTVSSFNDFVVGRYNAGSGNTGAWVASDPLFEIGNGTGSGVLASNAMTVLKNGNVGIGTASPVNALDIGSGGGIHLTSGVPTSTAAALYNSSGTLYWNGAAVGGGSVTGSGTTNYIPLFTGASALGNSVIAQSGGFIGIGTASPGTTFEVNGQSSMHTGTFSDPATGIFGNVKISQLADTINPSTPLAAGVNGAAGTNLNTYGVYINNLSTVSGTGKNFGAYVVGTNNYFSGNVGIGTAAPSSLLDIVAPGGRTYDAELRLGPSAIHSVTGSYPYSGTLITGNADGNGNQFLATYPSWFFDLGGRNPSGLASDADSINIRRSSPGSGYGGSTVLFKVTGSGNVGIGTSTPTARLSVNGSMSLANGAGTVGFIASSASGTASYTWPTSVAAGNFLQTDGSGNLSWASVGGGGDFFKNGSVAMTGAIVALPGTAAAPGVTFGGNTNVGLFQPASSMIGFSIGGAEQMRIDASGDVGIGITSIPAWMGPNGLYVAGYTQLRGVWNTGNFTFNGGTAPGVFWAGGGPSLTSDAALGTALVAQTSGAERMRIDASGNVGIGTNAPTAPLTVSYKSANSLVASPIIRMENPAGGTQSGFTFTFGGTLQSQIRADNNGNMVFASKGLQLFGYPTDFSINNDMQFGGPYLGTTPPMYIKGTGNVGIGTSTPAAKLAVNGSMILMGATSGYNGFIASAVAGSTVWTLPVSDGSSGQVLATDGSGNLSWVAAGGGGALWSASGTSAYYNTGKVGIGTSNPLDSLVVVGAANGSGSGHISIQNTTNGTNARGSLISAGDNSGINTEFGQVSSTFSAWPIVPAGAGFMMSNGTAGLSIFTSNVNAPIRFGTAGTAATNERMRIDSSGNVGIGTVSPVSRLSVNGSMTLMGSTSGYNGFIASAVAGSTIWTLPVNDGSGGQVLSTNGAGQLQWSSAGTGDFLKNGSVNMTGSLIGVAGNASAPAFAFTSDAMTGIYNSASGAVAFAGNGNNIATLSSTNLNVVATTSASSRTTGALTVGGGIGANGNIYGLNIVGTGGNFAVNNGYTYTVASGPAVTQLITANTGSLDNEVATSVFQVRNTAGTQQQAFIAAVSTTGAGITTPAMVFGRTTSTAIWAESMRIDGSGNVGINNTSPTDLLHLTVGQTNTTMGISVGNSTNGGASNTRIEARNFQSEAMGLYMPTASYFNQGSILASTGTLQSSGANGLNIAATVASAPVRFFTGGSSLSSERMRITSSGNVGIMTTTPGARLDVTQQTAGQVALQANASTTVFWQITNPSGGITAGWNASNAVEYVGKDTGTNRSINAAGTINASGADFAEWVDWPLMTQPEMGSIILYKGSYVVVSSPFTAAFIGNDIKDASRAILVAFAGQLPVRVRGVVHEGDLIIAGDDGTGFALSKDQVTLALAKKAVGTAWQSSDDQGLKRVNVAVGIGLGGNGYRDIASVNAKADSKADKAEVLELKQENQKLKDENAAIKARLDRIEQMLKH